MSGLASSVIITLPTSTSKPSAGLIAGVAVGGFIVIVVIVGIIVYCRRKWKTKKPHDEDAEAPEIPGARTKFTEGQNDNEFATTEETVTTGLRYPEDAVVGGRLSQMSMHGLGTS